MIYRLSFVNIIIKATLFQFKLNTMKIFNARKQKNIEINNLLQKIKYKVNENAEDFIFLPFLKIDGYRVHQEDPSIQLILKDLKKIGAIEFSFRTNEEINKTLEEAELSKNKPHIIEGYWIKIIEPKFSQLCEEYEKSIEKKLVKEIKNTYSVPNEYEVFVKDREIWINNYLIGKPHATGSNFEFFDYIQSQEPHKKISRDELPSEFGDLSLKKQVEKKSFIKILNGLGFKGEILKAFFYKRGKDTVTYAGNKISKEYLEKNGIKINILLKELDLAHDKNTNSSI